jgi:Rieske Fe-S protein
VADATEARDRQDAAVGADLTRGQFLTKMSLGLGGLMGALLVVPVAGMVVSPAVKGTDFTKVLMGPVEDFTAKPGEFVKVVLSPNADSFDAYVQKRVAFIRYNKNEKSDKIAAAITIEGQNQGKFSVVSNRCVHLGCPVQSSTTGFVCPCHGGAYDTEGKRTAGPPVRPLDRFGWVEKDGELWAVAEYSLTNEGEMVGLRGPGQHTSGPQSLLYQLQP